MSRKMALRLGVSLLALASPIVQAADKNVDAASATSAPAPQQVVGPNQLTVLPVPPMPPDAYVQRGAATLGNSLNKPVTGAGEQPVIEGGEKPPSLETLQATRPLGGQASTLEPGRADALFGAAISFGAQGGLAARAFAVNEMLRRYEGALDNIYNFQPLVIRLGGGQTMMRPPIVTQAQMAFALGESGQVARETGCIYEITRDAQLSSAPPNWRSYLVRHWAPPARPSDAVLPRTDEEAAYWNKWVAEGWGQGERQAVEIYLDDLGRLQRDIIGMARYQVLLRSGLVIHPKVVFSNSLVNGGGHELRAVDRIIRITDQKGLKADGRNWRRSSTSCPG